MWHSQSPFLPFLIFFLILVLHTAVLRAYPWHCTLESILVLFTGSYGMLEINPKVVSCRANTLPVVSCSLIVFLFPFKSSCWTGINFLGLSWERLHIGLLNISNCQQALRPRWNLEKRTCHCFVQLMRLKGTLGILRFAVSSHLNWYTKIHIWVPFRLSPGIHSFRFLNFYVFEFL